MVQKSELFAAAFGGFIALLGIGVAAGVSSAGTEAARADLLAVGVGAILVAQGVQLLYSADS